ncbi:MAG: polynucleotide adenylyltransferase PcnB [Pseudomonadota bacterium]
MNSSSKPSSTKSESGSEYPPPTIISRDNHTVSRKNISPNALKVLYRLKDAGYQAYLVGGGVRDALLGRTPKDFDITTDASPEEVKKVFRNCRLIGRRFRLAHVYFGREIIEVATFRANIDTAEDQDGEDMVIEDGRIVRDNQYGTREEDAWRRDFTINALYYNIADFTVLDFTDGMADLEAGLVRLIGDPEQRYREDPVRMLRAVRFAAKLDLTLHEETEQPINELSYLLEDISSSRLYDEVLKLFLSGHAQASFEQLNKYKLFNRLFSQTTEHLDDPVTRHMLEIAMHNTDERISQGRPTIPAFLLAVFLWQPLQTLMRALQEDEDMQPQESLFEAAHQINQAQAEQVAIPRRVSMDMREIWILQQRMENRSGKRALRVLTHPRFRAGYDFLLLRAEADETLREQADWWTRLYEAGEQERQNIVGAPKRRRRRRKKSSDTGENQHGRTGPDPENEGAG